MGFALYAVLGNWYGGSNSPQPMWWAFCCSITFISKGKIWKQIILKVGNCSLKSILLAIWRVWEPVAFELVKNEK